MTKILGYTPAVILAVFSVYYGIAIGYWSVEALLDRIENTIAFIVVFAVWLVTKLGSLTISKIWRVRKQLVAKLSETWSNIRYHQYKKSMNRENIHKAGRNILRVLMISLGFSVAFPIVSISLAVQLNEYRHLPIAWLLAPLLISIFGYTIGKCIGTFWCEMDRRFRCYKSKKEEYKNEFFQKRLQNY